VNRNAVVSFALNSPVDAIRRNLTTAIREESPGLFLIESSFTYQSLYRFAKKGNCSLTFVAEMDQDMAAHVHMGTVYENPELVWLEIEWQGAHYQFAQLQIGEGYQRRTHALVIGSSRESVHELLIAIGRFEAGLEGVVMVFQDGCWRADEELVCPHP
jgi:hypothetical protein